MGPSRESFSEAKTSVGSDPPSSHFRIFPPGSLIDETREDLEDLQTAHGGFLDYLLLKLWVEDLPGKKHAVRYLCDQHRRNCRPNTIKSSYITIVSFLRFIEEAGKSCLEEITKWDLEAFIEREQDRGLRLSSVRTRLQILKAFLRFLIEGGVVDPDVFPWKLKIKPPETLPRAMDPDDVKRLLSVVDHTRDRAMILLLLRTGMRIGELLNTKISDVHLNEKKILIFEAEKNRFGRVVYFSEDAFAALKAWFEERDPNREFLFYGLGKFSMSYHAARAKFCKYLQKARLSHKGYTLHCLRHTYATDLLNAGMKLECLEKLLGHTSLEVTRRYARLTDRTREEQYFRAMAIIERGEIDGHYQCDRELQTVFEETQLLHPHGKELLEHP
jgi:integrase/recombinase XerD